MAASKNLTLHWHKYAAELLATLVLTMVVLTISNSPLSPITPFAAALTVGLFVYTIGSISGAHINPAVTVGLLSIQKIEWREALIYIASQCLGALIAMVAFQSFFGPIPLPSMDGGMLVPVGEFIGAFLLVFGVSGVVFKKVSDSASGLTIGGSLLLGIVASSSFSLGILNPAVALGVGVGFSIYSLPYFVAPLVGGILAAWLYRWMVR